MDAGESPRIATCHHQKVTMPRRRLRRAAPPLLAIVLLALATASTSPARTAQTALPGPHRVTVTLITGDVVDVTTTADGRQVVSLEPGPDGRIPEAAITRADGHLYVTPARALPLLAAGRLDQRLFDVTGLIRQGYDDAHRSTLPVIVDYGHGGVAAFRARQHSAAPSAVMLRHPSATLLRHGRLRCRQAPRACVLGRRNRRFAAG